MTNEQLKEIRKTVELAKKRPPQWPLDPDWWVNAVESLLTEVHRLQLYIDDEVARGIEGACDRLEAELAILKEWKESRALAEDEEGEEPPD